MAIAKPALALGFLLCVGLSALPGGAAPLRVRGGAVIQVRATPVAGGLQIRGQLQDESNRPFGDAPIRLWLLPWRGQPPKDILLPAACGPTSPHSIQRGPGPAKYINVRANDAGRFCVLLPGKAVSGTVRLRFPGNDYFVATETELERRFHAPEPRPAVLA